MVNIKRLVNNKEFEFELTQEELKQVFKENNIQLAKSILENYKDIIVDYENIIKDEEQLVVFSESLYKKSIENNGDIEFEIINNLFNTKE